MSSQWPQLWTLSQEGIVAAVGRDQKSGPPDQGAVARRLSLEEASGWITAPGPQLRGGVNKHSSLLGWLGVPQPPSNPVLEKQLRRVTARPAQSSLGRDAGWGSRLRREALIGYVRQVLWGGGRASQLWQPHLGPAPKSWGLERDAGLGLRAAWRPGRGLLGPEQRSLI